MILKKIIRKPTLILILGSIFLIIGIPFGIYGFTLDGGKSLIGALILFANLGVFFTLLIDRAIVRVIPPLRLSVYEFILIVLGITIYLYTNRKIIVDIDNEDIEYLLVIENPGNLKNDETNLKFPFHKKISTKNGIVIVNEMTQNIDFNINANWNNSFYYNRYEFDKYPKVTFFCKSNFEYKENINQNWIDSLMNK